MGRIIFGKNPDQDHIQKINELGMVMSTLKRLKLLYNKRFSMGVPWTSRILNLLLRICSAQAPNGVALLYCVGVNKIVS